MAFGMNIALNKYGRDTKKRQKINNGEHDKKCMEILIVDNRPVCGGAVPDQKPLHHINIDTLEIFMNQAGMVLEKALLEKRLAELQKEKR